MPSSVLNTVPIVALKYGTTNGKGGKVVPRDYLERVQEIVISENENKSDEVTFKVVWSEGAPLDDPYFVEGKEVTFRYGWVGKMSRTYVLRVMAVNGPELDASGVVWQMVCHDNSANLMNKRRQKNYAIQKLRDVVASVCKHNDLQAYLQTSDGLFVQYSLSKGLGIDAQSVALTGQGSSNSPLLGISDKSFEELMNQTVSEAQHGISDKEFLDRLAHRIDHRIRVEGNKLYFEKPKYSKTAVKTFVWRDGQGPLMAFKPAAKQLGKTLGMAREVKAIGVDCAKKEKITATANEQTTKGRPAVGGKGSIVTDPVSGAQHWQPDTTGHLVAHPSSDPSKLNNLAQSMRGFAETRHIQATIVLQGDPTLGKHSVVRIANVDRRHQGNWMFIQTKHTISSSAFSTEGGAVRHGHMNKKGKSTANVRPPTERTDMKPKVPMVKINAQTGSVTVFQAGG